MSYKTRLIIIDKTYFPQWQADLQDKDCLEYYWNSTGQVTTYWMTAEDFLQSFPKWETVPRDLALYDRQLIISYDEHTRILSFDVLDGTSMIVQLFQSIEQQGLPALHELVLPEGLIDRTGKQ
jgi:hypothetical protein